MNAPISPDGIRPSAHNKKPALRSKPRRSLSVRRRAHKELRESHQDLERKLRERNEELTKANELLRRIFAGITVHIAYLDNTFKYISVNRAYAEAQGRTPDFFAGRNYFDLAPDDETRGIFEHVLRTGAPYTEYEKRIASPGRPEHDISYQDWSLQPVTDGDGSVSGLLLTTVDVSDRKRAEDSNIRLAAAVESAADAVVISDRRGIIRYVNPAFERITGYSRQEAVGRDQHILDTGRHDEQFFRELRSTIRREGSWKGRLLNRKKDGTVYTEECTYSPIRNRAGEIINYVSIKRDVTEKLWLESIAQSVETMNNIGYIFAGVRHEIGNPINSVTMILDVLRSKLGRLEKPAIEGYLDRALNELSRVRFLLRTLKSFNMYERPQMQSIPLPRFLEQFLSVVSEDFRSRGIALDVRADSGAETCYADPRALQQILLNFLANASDALHGRAEPAITIRVSAGEDVVRIQVTDNGCGMTEEEQKTLFKPFYTTKEKGTGLGLVIVKKMLSLMNGRIQISSIKNKGTIVEIALPAASRPDGQKG